MIACGTSYHAGWVGKALLEQLAGIPVSSLASNLHHQPLLSQTILHFLSQSGNSGQPSSVSKVNDQTYHTIHKLKGSTLSREANYITAILNCRMLNKAYCTNRVMAVLADAYALLKV